MTIDALPVNGAAHHQTGGRAVPELPTFTFQTTGRTISVRKISPMTMQRLQLAAQKENPPPQPPMFEVEIDGGAKVMEPNEADPSYQAAMKDYHRRITEIVGERFMRLCANYVMANEIPVDEVVDYRASMADAGAPIDEDDDRAVYLWEMCCISEEDIQNFQAFVLSMSQATMEAVQAHVRSFRSDL